MSLLSSIRSAAAGLRAASLGLEVTSHNVANASTEGYTRKSVQQSTSTPIKQKGNVWLGMGPQVDAVTRASDQFLGLQRTTAAGDDSSSTALYESLSVLEASFSEETGSTLPDLLGEFYDSLATLTSNPSEAAYRTNTIAAAEKLTYAVNATAKSLDSAVENTNAEIEEIFEGKVNSLLSRLGDLNALAESAHSTENTGATDTLDERDAVVTELAGLIGATVEYVGDGTVNLFVGGHAVVSGNSARTMEWEVDGATGDLKVLMSADSGKINVIDEVGGRVGGLLESHDYSSGWLDDLNTFVETFSDEFNNQHGLGYDQSGGFGSDLFQYTAGSEADTFAIDTAFMDDPTLLALAGSPTGGAGDQDNLRLLIDLQSNQTYGTSNQTPEDFLSSIYSSVGQAVVSAQTSAERDAVTLGDLEALHSSLTAVSLDEEATSLIAYQAAYQASAKVISAADDMLAVLMDMAR